MGVVTTSISGSDGTISITGSFILSGSTSGSEGHTSSSAGSTTYEGSGSYTTVSTSGSYVSSSATSGSTDDSAGSTVYHSPVGYHAVSSTGSYTSGSEGTTEVSGGSIIISGSSPGITLYTADLYVDGTANVTGAISSSSGLMLVGSITSSADAVVSGAVHATQFYGGGAGITGLSPTSLSGTTAQLTTGVETSGYLKVTGSTTLQGSLILNGTASTSALKVSSSISASSLLHVSKQATFGQNVLATGSITAGTSFVIGSADLNETDLEKLDGITDGVGASNKALVLDGTNDITSGLNSLKATYLTSSIYSGSMLLHNVGAATFGTTIAASGSVTAVGLYSTELISGSLGMHVDSPVTFGSTLNVTGNILTPSNIKSTAGYISASLQVKAQKLVINGITRIAANGDVDASMLSASHGMHVDQDATFGANVAITSSLGVGIASPVTALDVHHNPTTLSNDTGGGEVVKFGTGTLTTGKMYYLHSGSSWQQTDMILAESGGVGLLGIAVGSSPTSNGLLVRGFFDVHTYLSGVFTVGQPVYVSAPGYLTTMRPSGSAEIVRQVGYCTTTANVVYFNPSSEYIELV